MKIFNIIIRGFAYKENWIPLSTRHQTTDRYCINVLNNIQQYQKLINKLSSKYIVKFFISTYNTTPKNILDQLSNHINIDNILFSEENGSKQYTTSITAFDELDLQDLTLLLRSDIIITDKLIDIFADYEFDNEHVYVLCFEERGDKISDFFHIIPEKRIDDINTYFKALMMKIQHAHFLHRKVPTKTILNDRITRPVEYYKPYDSTINIQHMKDTI